MIEPDSRSLRVLIVDPSELLRRGVRDVLARDTRFRFSVVGDIANPAEAPPAYRHLMPDVAFLAVTAGPAAPVRHLHEIAAIDPAARIVALVERNDLDLMLRAIQGGARAILVRDAPATALLEAAHDVIEGGAALDMRLASVLFDYLAASGPASLESGPVLDPATLTALSPREQEVLRALAQGCRNKEIAAALGVSVGTVKTHLRHIFRKLKVADRTSAVLLALHARTDAA
jgi:DNA-binding NarL/FixJ family response regulator